MVAPRNERSVREMRMIALPVIAFVVYAPPHLPIESIKLAPVKCGLLTTSILSSAQLLRLYCL